MPSAEVSKVRIDKWLWATRVYKTRALSTEACKAGHVKVNGKAVKPARPVAVGEMISATVGSIHRVVKALVLIDKRVGAKVLDQYVEDLTPAAEYEKLKRSEPTPVFNHSKGRARPTKRDRRVFERFKAQSDSD
jgi:ribosome-associated heat shock protein Hsp15